MGQNVQVVSEPDIEFGSVEFFIGATEGSLVSVGVLRDAKFQYSYEKVQIPSDNGGVISRGIRNERALFSALLMEVNFDRLEDFYSGVLTRTPIAANPVSVAREDTELFDTDVAWLDYANGDKSEVASIVVKDATGVTTYDRDADYIIVVGADGRTGIARASVASDISDEATVRVAYQYTPNASVMLEAGGALTFTAQVVKFVNLNPAGKARTCTIYSATPTSGITIDFPSDDDVDPWLVPIELEGVPDTSKAAGKQLFKIVKET